MITIRERRHHETDDTARIQEAIDRAALANDDICFPAGSYEIHAPLILYGVVHIVGDRSEANG